jgi:deoxyribodipyrimidine photo-lyase
LNVRASPANTAIVWLRRDLRLTDNPALALASESAERIVFAYIHAPWEEAPWEPGAASRWWLYHSLKSLDADLAARGQRLIIRAGPSLTVLRALISETGATSVVWNRLYEPATIARDKVVKAALREDGIVAQSGNGALLFEPWQIHTDKGEPYRVFTPFWKRCLKSLGEIGTPAAVPDLGQAPPATVTSVDPDSLGLLPRLRWDLGLTDHWQPGEAGAHERVARLEEDIVGRYGDTRNRPDLMGTSRLSPHLHFGEISPRQVIAGLGPARIEAGSAAGAEAFIRELGWREFTHHLLFHFPATHAAPLDARFAAYRWQSNAAWLKAWQRGQTGYPIVDAGMRELWHTGWMHNRVRMIAASLLVKNLQTDWLDGARWFWDTLVDADLANNTAGWQWTAGCGADAAPYYRIFNPVLQSERFDPDCRYVRHWVPELAALPDKWLPRPWEAPAEVLESCGIELGKTYPRPLVDFRESRERALKGYADLKGAPA